MTDLHPDCVHPVANSSDDYAGTECCMCAGSPCSAVTSPLAFAHADFLADYEPRDSLLPDWTWPDEANPVAVDGWGPR